MQLPLERRVVGVFEIFGQYHSGKLINLLEINTHDNTKNKRSCIFNVHCREGRQWSYPLDEDCVVIVSPAANVLEFRCGNNFISFLQEWWNHHL